MNPRLVVLALASFAAGTETYVFSGLLARLAADLQVSVATAGQLAAAFALVYALCAPFTAVAAARWDRKPVLIAALLALALLNAIATVVPSFAALLAVRIVCGVVATLAVPIAGAAAVSMVPEAQQGRAIAVVMGGLTLAFLLGIPLGTVIGDLFGWRYSFGFSALLTALAALLIGWLLPRVPSQDRPGLRSLAVVLRRPVLVNLALTVAAFTAMFCVIAFIGPVVTQISGRQGSGVGLIQSVVGIGSLLGIVLGGRAADRGDTRRPVALALLVMGAVLSNYSILMMGGYLPGATLTPWLLAAMVMAGSGSLFALTPMLQVRLIAAAPDARNVVLAVNGAMIYLGQGLGAALGGVTVAVGGLTWLGAVGAAIALTAALLAVRSRAAASTSAGYGRRLAVKSPAAPRRAAPSGP